MANQERTKQDKSGPSKDQEPRQQKQQEKKSEPRQGERGAPLGDGRKGGEEEH